MTTNRKISFFFLPFMTTLLLHANDPFFNDPFGDNIFKEMMQMQEEMDKMFQRMHERIQQRTKRQIAPLGTYKIEQKKQFEDKGNHYEYMTNIPQNKENRIDIGAKDGVMSITAKIIEKHENKTANAYSTSSSMRMYQHSIPLPEDADESSLSAEYKDKKLVIIVKKRKNNTKIIPKEHGDTSKDIPPMKKTQEEKSKGDKKSIESNSSKKEITVNSDLPSMS